MWNLFDKLWNFYEKKETTKTQNLQNQVEKKKFGNNSSKKSLEKSFKSEKLKDSLENSESQIVLLKTDFEDENKDEKNTNENNFRKDFDSTFDSNFENNFRGFDNFESESNEFQNPKLEEKLEIQGEKTKTVIPKNGSKKVESEANFDREITNEKINEKSKKLGNSEKMDTEIEQKKLEKKLQNQEDLETIKQILAGNRDLFETILDDYQHQILVYCTRLLNWHVEDGKDATSTTFVKAYVNLASFNPKLQFSSWLYRIAHNESVNKIKQNAKNWTLPIDKIMEKNGESDKFTHNSRNFLQNENENEIPNLSSISKMAIFDEDDKKVDLDKVLSQLKNDDKNILVLFYIQELSLEQIGEILKITTNNAKTRLFRARDKAKKLAQKL